MSVSLYKIKKWYRMITGQSILHVNQDIGKCYSKTKVKGYYNDLTEKVTKDDLSILIPQYQVDTGESIFFSIGIFQYGLAAYDLYLISNDDIYISKLIACADWAVENQQIDGGWVTFAYDNPEHPYSSMAQGEGISLLIRAHIVTNNENYILAAKKAKDFMLKPVGKGGTARYEGGETYLYEYTNEPLVLNGWIFSLWGLYDFYKYLGDDNVKKVLISTLQSMKKKLPEYDLQYWSKYDDGKRIASPFYHKLHIAQLTAMYDLFGDDIFKIYADKWKGYQDSFVKPKFAFVKKAVQKIFEK